MQVGRRIGKGAFGEVCEATLRTSGERVAVKTCRSNELTDMDKFMQEADILKQYEHPNIVRLIGVCAEKDPVYIVMELMLGGALLEFLRKKGSQQPQKKLCGMAIDACRGMEYLEQNKCIHRYVCVHVYRCIIMIYMCVIIIVPLCISCIVWTHK